MRPVAGLCLFAAICTTGASAMASQPVVTILQPFTASSIVKGAFSFPNPKTPSHPYLVFGTTDNQGGLRIYTDLSADPVVAHDPSCGMNQCHPYAMYPNNGDHACWISQRTMGCASLTTGNVTWSKAFDSELPAASSLSYPGMGLIAPHLMWYQNSRVSLHNNLVDLDSGAVVSTTSTNPMLNLSGVSATVCTEKVCVSLTQSNGDFSNLVVGYEATNFSKSLWTVALPTTPSNVAGNLALSTLPNGHAVVVGADSTCVFGIDVVTGVALFNSSYAGAPFNPTTNYASGSNMVGACSSVVVVLGQYHVHILALATGALVATVPTGANTLPTWNDFACSANGLHFYLGVTSAVTFAVFGTISGTFKTPQVSTHFLNLPDVDQVAWSNDGFGTVLYITADIAAYSLATGALLWTATVAGSSTYPAYPVRAVNTPIVCFAGPSLNAQVECVDTSVPAATFQRNSSFGVGVVDGAVITAPSMGDGSCFLEPTTLRLLIDTATAAGDPNANATSNSNTGSSSESPEFQRETAASPIMATMPNQMKLAIVVATLQSNSGYLDCVRAFDMATGLLHWVHCLPTTLLLTPYATPNTIFAVDITLTLHAINVSTGVKQWWQTIPNSGSANPPCAGLTFDATYRNVYTASDTSFTRFSTTTGAVLWTMPITNEAFVLLRPVLAGGVLYTCYTTDGPMYCNQVDPTTGYVRGATAIIPTPSQSPELIVYKGRFLVNTADGRTVRAGPTSSNTTVQAGLFEINWANVTLSHSIIELPPAPGATRDCLFLGITDDLVAFKVRTTNAVTFVDSVEVRKLSSGAVVWSLNNEVQVGARSGRILNQGIFASPDAAVISAVVPDFVLVYDWYTGARLRAIPRSTGDEAPTLRFSTAGNSTLFYLRESTNPGELDAFTNLRPPTEYTSPAPVWTDAPLPPLPPAPQTTTPLPSPPPPTTTIKPPTPPLPTAPPTTATAMPPTTSSPPTAHPPTTLHPRPLHPTTPVPPPTPKNSVNPTDTPRGGSQHGHAHRSKKNRGNVRQ